MITIDSLTRDYGAGKGIFDVSFSVDKGETFGFLGPNGAGKTTTIRHLLGFLKPVSGKCEINGLDCWADRDKIQAKLGYIPGEISFFDDMTGTEYLRFMEQYRKLGTESRKEELLTFFQLDPQAKLKKMSKGMKQKIALVVAMMHDPAILIFDEPTSGLDPLMQNKFIDFINTEKKRGKTILLSSHMFEEVERTCDRIGIIRNGRLVTVNPVQELRNRHIRSYTVTLETEELATAFAKDFYGTQNGRNVTVTAKQSLEDIFIHYYRGEQID